MYVIRRTMFIDGAWHHRYAATDIDWNVFGPNVMLFSSQDEAWDVVDIACTEEEKAECVVVQAPMDANNN